MFAPKLTKVQTRRAANSAIDLGLRRSTLALRPGPGQEQEADTDHNEAQGVTPDVAWDFSKIPVSSRLPTRATQHRLIVGQTDDPMEHEADRAAEAVLAGGLVPAPSLAPTPLSHKYAASEVEHSTVRLRVMEDTIQRSAEGGYASKVEAAVASGGAPIPADIRAYLEPRFGHDFSHVRVHDNAVAAAAARSINSRAFTLGANIAFAQGEYAPRTAQGRRLLAHELAHVIQQRPNLGSGIRGLVQRQGTAATPAPAAPSAKPVGDAVKPEVEALLKTFASASNYEAKNASAMKAVNIIIRAYSMSIKGLGTMRFNPALNPKHSAETGQMEGNDRVSEIEFGPSAFQYGFEGLASIVAHELEHVRQNLIGGYHRGDEDEPVSEFLAYNAEVLQVQNVAGPAGRGLLGALKTGADPRVPALPPLPPDYLAHVAERALEEFSKMSSADQKKPQYRQELGASGARLFERLKNEAPLGLRPPPKFTPEWSRWYEGKPPSDDPFSIEYQDWLDALKSPWVRVKEVWKRFDAVFRV
jgi:Domain of unknown function (DUF4157)